MKLSRNHIETAIEALIDLLDEIDGDPDLEPEPLEQEHDTEADPAENGIADKAALDFVLAESSR